MKTASPVKKTGIKRRSSEVEQAYENHDAIKQREDERAQIAEDIKRQRLGQDDEGNTIHEEESEVKSSSTYKYD